MLTMTPEEAATARLVALRGLVAMLGWSQTDLAKVTGIAQTTISDILLGRCSPSADTLDTLLVAAVQVGPGTARGRWRRRRVTAPVSGLPEARSDAGDGTAGK